MEKPQEHKKKSAMSRVIAPNEEMENVVKSSLGEIFDGNVTIPELDAFKKEATEHGPELDEVLNLINAQMKEFLLGYGLESLDIRPSKIYVLDAPKVKKDFLKLRGVAPDKSKDIGGWFNLSAQEIFLFFGYKDGMKLLVAHTIVHELIHFNSFYSSQLSRTQNESTLGEIGIADDENPEDPLTGDWMINMRRYGFAMQIRGEKPDLYFNELNEAIVEALALRFTDKYLKPLPIFQEDLKRKEKLSPDNRRDDPDSLATEETTPKRFFGLIDGKTRIACVTAYKAERQILDKLIDDLYEMNKDQYSSREDVFNLFVNAMLKGRMLPLARLMKKSFGKDALRELGKASSDQF